MAYCDWKNVSKKMCSYHDREWGYPTHDDRRLYEYLFLEGMQAGLSWNLMIEKREIFRSCFDDFDYEKIAAFTEEDVQRILATPGMIRSRRKIDGMITNAGVFLEVKRGYGSFDAYIWSYSDFQTLQYTGHEKGNVPARNMLSERIAKDMKKKGFLFVGPVIVYSFLQAIGMINDHDENCPCFKEIMGSYPIRIVKEEEEV